MHLEFRPGRVANSDGRQLPAERSISGLLEALAACTRLRTITIGASRGLVKESCLPAEISQLSSLEALSINGCSLHISSAALHGLAALRRLQLHGIVCSATDRAQLPPGLLELSTGGPGWIAAPLPPALTSLEAGSLPDNRGKANGAALQALLPLLQGLTALRSLSLSGGKPSEPSAELPPLPALRSLSLQRCGGLRVPAAMATQLTALALASADACHDLPRLLPHLVACSVLDVSGSLDQLALAAAYVDRIAALPGLRVLGARNTSCASQNAPSAWAEDVVPRLAAHRHQRGLPCLDIVADGSAPLLPKFALLRHAAGFTFDECLWLGCPLGCSATS